MSLRKALLHKPMAEDRVHFGHTFERFEQTGSAEGPLTLHFEGGISASADILFAADGSNSRINRQVGLDNKVKLSDITLIQARALIDAATRDRLPTSLTSNGAVLFLGGRRITGFASIFEPYMETEPADGKKWNLFWAVLLDHADGGPMVAKAGDDHEMLIDLLLEHVQRALGYGDSLPIIMSSATEHVRTGLLTSSVQPKADWRQENAVTPRVILLGDAVHPMTPGRGQGANQALTDAGELIQALKNADLTGEGTSFEKELAGIVHKFETEMYPRAFEMVKQSQMATDLDLTALKGRLIIRAVGAAMTVVGWGMSILEAVGLRAPEKMDWETLPSSAR